MILMKGDCDLIIRNARLIDERGLMDIAIRGDKIVSVDIKIEMESKEELNAECKLTLPGFIDSHMHLDKAFSGGERKWVTNTLDEAIDVSLREKQRFTFEDVKDRARKATRMALKNGTTAIRTHVDLGNLADLASLSALIELRKELHSLIDLQMVAFIVAPLTTSDVGESILRKAMMMGADVVGGAPHDDPNPEKYIDVILKIAREYNADVDLHIDESNDPKDLVLECYAEKTVENRYEGRVTASHCNSLAAISDDAATRVIRKVREAKMNVIANPFTNLYLWGKDGKPTGVTRVRELLDAGVNVAYATDNTLDPFNPLGNADMLLAALFMAYTKHLGSDASTILKMGTYNAAKATKMIQNYGIKNGGRADIIILDAEGAQDAIIDRAERLYVIKNGKIVAKNGVLTSKD